MDLQVQYLSKEESLYTVSLLSVLFFGQNEN